MFSLKKSELIRPHPQKTCRDWDDLYYGPDGFLEVSPLSVTVIILLLFMVWQIKDDVMMMTMTMTATATMMMMMIQPLNDAL